MLSMSEFRQMLKDVDRSYDDFVHGVISYVKIPGNEAKVQMILDYIIRHPEANSSAVLEFMIKETGYFESIG